MRYLSWAEKASADVGAVVVGRFTVCGKAHALWLPSAKNARKVRYLIVEAVFELRGQVYEGLGCNEHVLITVQFVKKDRDRSGISRIDASPNEAVHYEQQQQHNYSSVPCTPSIPYKQRHDNSDEVPF